MGDLDLEKWLTESEYNTWNSGKQKQDMETIARLRKRLEEATEVIEFYADEKNYYRDRDGDWRLDHSNPMQKACEFLDSEEKKDE